MKLASFCRPDASRGWGLVTDAGIIDLASESAGLRQALEDGISWADHADREPSFQVNQVEFLPPIPDPEKIICVGLNYRSHIAESGREAPKKPVIFTRFANSQMGHGQPMVRPNASEQLDFEGELAVIIGKRGRHIGRDKAFDHVLGYSCYNDGSVRDWQRHTHQFAPGKNFVSTGGFGPWIVTADEIEDVGKANAGDAPQWRRGPAHHHRRPPVRYSRYHRVLLDIHRARARRRDCDRHDRRRRSGAQSAPVDEAWRRH